MEHRNLGRTGVSVSPLRLGTMMFGAGGNPDHDASIRIIRAALDAGINFVETADAYSGGESEVIVGKADGDCSIAVNPSERPGPSRFRELGSAARVLAFVLAVGRSLSAGGSDTPRPSVRLHQVLRTG